MPARWSFSAFDWERYRALEPVLRAACETGDFAHLPIEEAEEILETVDEEASPEEACNALVTELCAHGEVVIFETGLPELILWMRRHKHGEEAAEILGELVSAAPNREPWFEAPIGLAGMLSPDRTRELAAHLAALETISPRPEPPRGLLGWIRRFVPSDPAHALLEDLIRVVEESAAHHDGLAIIREP